jgi:REP element-mobilizing transposase RayT
MARPIRIEHEGALYHVTARGNERGKIFFSKRDYNKFKEYLADIETKHGVILHAYVLMSNHYHLLVETPTAPSSLPNRMACGTISTRGGGSSPARTVTAIP